MSKSVEGGYGKGFLTALFLANILPLSAHAAETAEAAAATSDAGADAGDAGTEEILVTARKRTESVQDVPIAISVISGSSLESKAASNLQQAYQEVPSMQVFTVNPRNVTVNIRGLGTNVATPNIGLDLGVGFYVDDVYYARIGPAVFDMLDVDRIEVLRGPQGTLFGRNTTAGAISITSREPSFTTEGTAEIGIGNYALMQARGSLAGPIAGDKLAGRISFGASSRSGFLDNITQLRSVHDLENYNVRGQLLFKPTEAVDVRLIADYARQRANCCVPVPLGYVTHYDNGAPVAYPYAERVAQFGYVPVPVDPKARRTDADRLRAYKSSQGGVSLNVDWDLGDATFTSISAFRFWKSAPRNDGDISALQILVEGNQDDDQRQWSQEFRISSNGERTLDYTAGLYYFHQTYPGLLRQEFGRDAGRFYIAPGTSGLTDAQRAETLDGAYNIATSVAKTDSFAAYGQFTWHINDGLSLTGGLRYTYELKSGNYISVRGRRGGTAGFNAAQIALFNSFTPDVPYYELSKNWGSLSGVATLSQKLSDDAQIYATYSHGAKSGGLNFANLPRDANGNALLELAVVAPERVDNYEVGLKTQWFDRRLTANIALFQTDISNYQSNVLDFTVTPVRIYIANVGTVRSKGIELDLRAQPTDNLNLYLSGSYNPASYRSYKAAQCPFELLAPGQPSVCDLSGKPLPAASRYGLSAGADFSFAVAGDWNGFVGADYSYRSSYYSTYNDTRYSLVPEASLVNARVGLRDRQGNWEATLWSRNLFNKTHFYAKNIEPAGGRNHGYLTDPRTWGLTVRRNF
jgi:iron complex outermembrane receptor protein